MESDLDRGPWLDAISAIIMAAQKSIMDAIENIEGPPSRLFLIFHLLGNEHGSLKLLKWQTIMS